MARRRKKASGGGTKKRRYTMSPKARAQRRVAARKHGLRASTPLRQVLPACNRRQCPLRDPEGGNAYPCTLKQQADQQGMVVESCPVALAVNPELKSLYERAIREGNPDHVASLAATSLGAMVELAHSELAHLKQEGFRVDTPVLDDQGSEVGSVPHTNPRAFPTLKLLEHLGHTGPQQAVTPKAAGERERDQGIAGMLAAGRDLRRRLGAGDTP